MSQVIRDFFTFNKSDRNGMILLILLLIAFITIPKIQEHLVVQKKPDFSSVQQAGLMSSDPVKSGEKQQATVDDNASSTTSNQTSKATRDQNTIDYKKSGFKEKILEHSSYVKSGSNERKNDHSEGFAKDYVEPAKKQVKSYEAPKNPVVLKDFDPNKITLEEALSLGFSKKIAATLLKYRSKGGQFYSKESLKKIYGMTDEFYENLEPYIKIESQKPKFVPKPKEEEVEEKREIVLKEFNPNTLDKEQALSLGLSDRVASNIEKYLSKGGQFYKKEDLKKIYNFEESDYVRLEKYIKIPKRKKRKWKNF